MSAARLPVGFQQPPSVTAAGFSQAVQLALPLLSTAEPPVMFQQPPPIIAAQSSPNAPPPANQTQLPDAGQPATIQPQQLNVAGLQPGVQQPLPNEGGLPIIQPQAFSTPSHHTSYLPEWAGQPHTDPNIQLTPAALRALPREDQARVIWRSNP